MRKIDRGGGSSMTFRSALALDGRQVLGAIDDADPIAAIGRRGAEHFDGLAHRIDRYGRRGGFLVRRRRAAQHGEVRVGQGRDLPGDTGIRRAIERVDGALVASAPGRARRGRRDRRGSPCRSPAARRSARHGEACPVAILRETPLSPSRWPKKANCSRGCGAPSNPSGSVSLISRAIGSASGPGAREFREARLHRLPDRRLDLVGRAIRRDHHASVGFCSGDREKRLAELVCGTRGPPPRTGRRPRLSSRDGACAA